jgi:hypothetical protein
VGVDCSKIDGCRTLSAPAGNRRSDREGHVFPKGGSFQLPTTVSRRLDLRITALRKANEVRIGRARLKQQLRVGDARIEQILATPPECVCTATVLDLLLCVPKIGPVRAGRLLSTARVSQTKIIGTLTERQRAYLIDLLRR